MKARVGTLPVGARFDTLLTGRRGVVRAIRFVTETGEKSIDVTLETSTGAETRWLHPDVLVETEAIH